MDHPEIPLGQNLKHSQHAEKCVRTGYNGAGLEANLFPNPR
jgi:hypothetical protein